MSDDRSYWERHARRYDRSTRFLGRPLPRALALAAAAVLGRADVLELAAGTGAFTAAIAPEVGALIATDYAQAMVDALAQLVLHFVGDPAAAARELRRVVRPGGTIAACVWDFAEGMQMLRLFWNAAMAVDPGAPDEARVLRFGRAGEIAALFADAGMQTIDETLLDVEAAYDDFDALWAGFLAGVGPAGAYCVALPAAQRDRLRDDLARRLGAPRGGFTLAARARCVRATAP